jgi:hypothetical protein
MKRLLVTVAFILLLPALSFCPRSWGPPFPSVSMACDPTASGNACVDFSKNPPPNDWRDPRSNHGGQTLPLRSMLEIAIALGLLSAILRR